MKVGRWFALRGPGFVKKRAAVLLRRYGFRPEKAKGRIEKCLATLSLHGCRPTFPVPGKVVNRHHSFVRSLEDAGAEIAVHSYDHIDLKALPPPEAARQLVKAAQTFELHGIEWRGFRCPYLRCPDDLADLLPKGLFAYSSNVAIRWEVNSSAENDQARVVFETINGFYKPRDSRDVASVPWMKESLVEIPVCVPDDLQLHDGLGLDPGGIQDAWSQFLKQTHKRGELFTLIFHPELFEYCEQPFIAVLQEARSLKPFVWVARLREIDEWWREKSKFQAEIHPHSARLRIAFNCSSRATVLAKGLDMDGTAEAWDKPYFRVKAKTLEVPAQPRPFVGIGPNIPGSTVSFLQDQGYILDMTETAPQCAVFLDDPSLGGLNSQVELVDSIERSAGAKSALSVTGDLDALSLLDYISRLF